MRRIPLRELSGALLSLGMVGAPAIAQVSTLKVVGSDSVPIPYAWVSIRGGTASITDEHGVLTLGKMHRKTLTANVRRLGYQPWFGTLTVPDTAVTLTVVLPRIAQQLGAVTVTADHIQSALKLTGFYDRWLERQKGALSATFIGPEEIEQRHAAHTTDLLTGLNGVSFVHTPGGGMVAQGMGGTCNMTILLDGHRLCPDAGCNTQGPANEGAVGIGIAVPLPPINGMQPTGSDQDPRVVDLNKYIDATDVAAIEVYARGGNMPISLQADDNACGVIAIWTGARK